MTGRRRRASPPRTRTGLRTSAIQRTDQYYTFGLRGPGGRGDIGRAPLYRPATGPNPTMRHNIHPFAAGDETELPGNSVDWERTAAPLRWMIIGTRQKKWERGMVFEGPYHSAPRDQSGHSNAARTHPDRQGIVLSGAGQFVYSCRRKFVVIEAGLQITALPIFTYGLQGLAGRPEAEKYEYVGIRDSRENGEDQAWTEAEPMPPNGPGGKPNIIYTPRADLSNVERVRINPVAYIHFTEAVTFDIRTPVQWIGNISQDDTNRLTHYHTMRFLRTLQGIPNKLLYVFDEANLNRRLREERTRQRALVHTEFQRHWQTNVRNLQAAAERNKPGGDFVQLPIGENATSTEESLLYRWVPKNQVEELSGGIMGLLNRGTQYLSSSPNTPNIATPLFKPAAAINLPYTMPYPRPVGPVAAAMALDYLEYSNQEFFAPPGI